MTRSRSVSEDPLSDIENIDPEQQEKDQPIPKKRKIEEDTNGSTSTFPLSVTTIENPLQFKSSTYSSPIPQAILDDKESSVVLGVDEAGRGPVLGAMVYGVAYALENFSNSLQKKYGFADSKTLKEERRQELFDLIENNNEELHEQVGWATTTLTARDISSGMLKGSGKVYNLNEQAHDTTIDLIKLVISQGVNLTKVYVDTVGPPQTYQTKLSKIFPGIDITVAKKADSIYPIVSTASIVAKVTRDQNLKWYNENVIILNNHKLGSGYPSDPNTSKWLNSNVDKVFGWCYGFIRFSWQTAKDSLIKHDGVNVIYEQQCMKKEKGYNDVGNFFNGTSPNSSQKVIPSFIDKSYYNSDIVNL
ncbi:ribonuclease HII-domain-containing protein [Scheffersomyces coipomensis]|uniref:ribonuclease HII-domain-containing protein n=1 Tax=Scheffersomyces coipomensis TaxID=1788519 RepID=UPI00315DFA4A